VGRGRRPLQFTSPCGDDDYFFVLEGEQHLYDYDEKSATKSDTPRIRRIGDYGLSVGVERPHLENGGPNGGIALFSTHTNDGSPYEILDDELNLILPITIELLVADFNEFAK